MAVPSGVVNPRPVPVVGPQFCVPYTVDLSMVRKVMNITDGNFVVTDVNGNLIFKVEGIFFTLHDRRVIVDATGNPIVTLREKTLTAHERWEAFRGDSSEPRDVMFTVKRSRLIQIKTKLHVFLAHNTRESVYDYMIEGSLLDQTCTIYSGESTTTIVAQMRKKHDAKSLFLGKDHFMVTVYPNVDHAFIIALLVILYQINN